MEKMKLWLSNLGITAADRVLSAFLVLLVGLFVLRLIMKLVKRSLERSKLEKAAHTLVLSLTRVVLWLLLCLITASTLGVDVTGIVALASVLTLAVSLALQNVLGNVLGGFTLLSTHPFRSGDFVEIAGQSGTVEEINMTYTRLATPDNKQIFIPNSAVVAAQIVNYSQGGIRRVEIKVRAPYHVEPQRVMDALVQAGTVDSVLLEPAPAAVLVNYGESALEYSLRLWVASDDYWDVFFAVNERVYRVFREQGIEIAIPRVQLQLDQSVKSE